MPNINASISAARAALPQQNVRGNLQGGDTQIFVSTVTIPPTGGPVVGEHISWGFLPMGARIMPNARIFISAGAASSTINLGDPVAPARYMAATSATTAGSLLAEAQYANGALTEVDVVAPGMANDRSELRSTVAGAALQPGQVLTLVLEYATNN